MASRHHHQGISNNIPLGDDVSIPASAIYNALNILGTYSRLTLVDLLEIEYGIVVRREEEEEEGNSNNNHLLPPISSDQLQSALNKLIGSATPIVMKMVGAELARIRK